MMKKSKSQVTTEAWTSEEAGQVHPEHQDLKGKFSQFGNKSAKNKFVIPALLFLFLAVFILNRNNTTQNDEAEQALQFDNAVTQYLVVSQTYNLCLSAVTTVNGIRTAIIGIYDYIDSNLQGETQDLRATLDSTTPPREIRSCGVVPVPPKREDFTS